MNLADNYSEIDEAIGYDPIAVAQQNPQSKALAIKAFCCSCVGGMVPNWRNEIRNCTANGKDGASLCPLYVQRPYK